MKTQYRSQKQVSNEYINLCFKCEIPVKEAIKSGYKLSDLLAIVNGASFDLEDACCLTE